jgi:iron complex outermembrane receptor protein
MASLGTTYRKDAFSFSPIVHYTGRRYGDALQKEPVPDYYTVDMNMGYETKLPIGKAHASLSVDNLFNRQYVGFIDASYLQNAGQTSYYPGAPRSLVLKLSIDM